MNNKKLSPRIFNLEQANKMMSYGAFTKEARMVYYEDSEKLLFYVRFLDDDIYRQAMELWRRHEL